MLLGRYGAGRVDRTPGLRFTRTALFRLSYASEGTNRTMAPAALSAAALWARRSRARRHRPILWTFTMKNSPAPKRQITQETSKTHELCQADAWSPVNRLGSATCPMQPGA